MREAITAEVRIRHERMLGKAMQDMPKDIGGRPPDKKTGGTYPSVNPPTLDSLGIDKDLAKNARAASKLDDATFDKVLDIYREDEQTVTAVWRGSLTT